MKVEEAEGQRERKKEMKEKYEKGREERTFPQTAWNFCGIRAEQGPLCRRNSTWTEGLAL